jgi:CheY-like chemotaxis protein
LREHSSPCDFDDVTRTLSGHLEDLDLDEIVRVIALSRRSGLLTVDGVEGKAELSFVSGRLVRGRLQDAIETIGQLLARAGMIDEDDLQAPPGVSDGAEALDDAVTRLSDESGDRGLLVRVDDFIAEHLQALALRVMLYKTGSFNFRVTSDDAPPLRYPRDTALTLPAGIDADELSREAKRRRADRKADPLSAMSGSGSQPPRRAQSEHVELFLVDDDPAFLQQAEKSCGEAGIHTAVIANARAAIERFFALGASENPSFMVVDLVMPRSNGKGILGGLEVLKRAADVDLAGRVFLALEEPHADAEAAAKELGAAGLVKKSRAKAHDEPALASYLNPIFERLRRAPLVAASFDLARELRLELGDTGGDWRTEGGKIIDENVRSLETLKALLGELNEPTFDEEIPLLVLRFASAFFVRGALFSVDHKKGELVGLGAFGLGVADPGRLVRSIHIPIAADTVFTRALKEKAGVRQPFFDSEHNSRLTSALGGPRPREVYTAPLISPRGVEGVIYADNATDARPFPDIHLLEIFLQQSAAAIERATLKNQLKRLMAASA